MYTERTKEELIALKAELEKEYEALKSKGLKLDMSRGKPCSEQLDLSKDMLYIDLGNFKSESGFDCRNYGMLDGIIEAKRLFMSMLGIENPDEIILGGNASLQLMYDTFARAKYAKGTKFICPVPGYDRHFTILEHFGIEMISVPFINSDLDMDEIEKLAASDADIKGMICVPVYSNPDGFTFSAETVKRLAAMKTADESFKIYWDNAYCMHHLADAPDTIPNIIAECAKAGNPDRAYVFASTSKVTFAGGGICAVASSIVNIKAIQKEMSVQTIGFDKLNQLRHAKFLPNSEALAAHMQKHRAVIEPKFNLVCEILDRDLKPNNLGEWHKPRGGYFISFNGFKGTAKRVVELCKQAGLILTGAGATFPYGKDPDDKNIRIAPTFPPLGELESAMEIFCACVKLASIEVLLAKS
ncbi:MAG: aminotransferase class I/II-fold pyridoxal phosphate-dependent enzyme [Oscillospiraceae bacterium]|nr:aminotransferase class I/II-fold pyridoxal phosphate-dependent enzyme [Oscillospiraceae bacterium]